MTEQNVTEQNEDAKNVGNEIVNQALTNIGQAAALSNTNLQEGTTASGEGTVADGDTPKKDGNDVASSFAGLPIESLIGGPFLAAAKVQQQLAATYVDTVMKLAYREKKKKEENEETKQETNILTFEVPRPVINEEADGKTSVTVENMQINAPLLALVQIPSFQMDEVTVDFDMEVKTSDMKSDETKADVSSTVNFKSWFGLNASITGNVSSDSVHKRESDSSATYKIHARAIQQPPSEGMAKLTSLLTQAMEPLRKPESSGGGGGTK